MNPNRDPQWPAEPTAEPTMLLLAEGAITLQVGAPWADIVPAQRLVAAVEATLHHANRADGEVTVVIGDDELLRQLNREYRGIDAATDVLSFGVEEPADEAPSGFVSAPEATAYLGDVIISYPTAARQADAAGHALLDELCLLAIHGTLHLLGHDHDTAEEERAMWAVQATLLEQLGITLSVPPQIT